MQDQGCCPCDARSQDRENSHFFGPSVRSVTWLLEREAALDPRKWHAALYAQWWAKIQNEVQLRSNSPGP